MRAALYRRDFLRLEVLRRRRVPNMPLAMDLLSSRPMVEDIERAKDFIAASVMVSERDDRRREPFEVEDRDPTRWLPPPLP